jgi:hypothetical protein
MRADADRHVTLVVPGLLGPLAAPASDHDEAARLLCEGLSPRALERFLGRATREPVVVAEEGLAATLFGCFGVSRSGPDWPVAAVTRSVDAGGVDPRWTLRVDPVHLRASMGELMLADDTALRVSAPEAAALVAEINAELGEPDLCIEALAPKRWYLCPQQPPRLVTRAPWDMVGVPIGANVPGGDDGARWRALVNDIQMILHASPVNRARESRGEAPVNSVWPWGGGCVPKLPPPAWQGVWADETLVEGLARLAGTPCRALPDDARDWLAQVDAPGGNLAGGDLAGGDLAGRRWLAALRRAPGARLDCASGRWARERSAIERRVANRRPVGLSPRAPAFASLVAPSSALGAYSGLQPPPLGSAEVILPAAGRAVVQVGKLALALAQQILIAQRQSALTGAAGRLQLGDAPAQPADVVAEDARGMCRRCCHAPLIGGRPGVAFGELHGHTGTSHALRNGATTVIKKVTSTAAITQAPTTWLASADISTLWSPVNSGPIFLLPNLSTVLVWQGPGQTRVYFHTFRVDRV